ncbi:hypothetical protein QAZ18_10590, partial [Glaesserella parasuis]|uniref:hypothetical protein n=2 Tax=Glaesserella parasuis TaxID=738 RepID=UPI0021BD95C9
FQNLLIRPTGMAKQKDITAIEDAHFTHQLLANDAQRLEKRKLQVLNIKMVLPLMSTISKLFETHSN